MEMQTNEVTPVNPTGPTVPVNQTVPTVNIKYSPSSQKKVIIGSIIAVIVLVIGGVCVWAYSSYVSPDPQATINKSISNFVDQINKKGIMDGKSVFEVKASGSLPQVSGVESTADLNISADTLTDVKSKKLSTDISFNLALNIGLMNITVDGKDFVKVIYSGNREFIKINAIPAGLSQYASMFMKPEELSFINSEVIGKWIEIDNDQLDTLSKMGVAKFSTAITSSLGANVSNSNIAPLLHALAVSNIFVIDKVLPADTINGQSVFHYRVKLDKTGLTNFVIAATKAANGGQYLAGIDENYLRTNMDQSFAQYDQLSQSGVKLDFDIYIGRFSKSLVKITANVDAGNLPQLNKMGITKATATATTTYSFPASASIVEPESYTSLMSLLVKIGVAFGGTNSSQPYVDSINGFSIIPPEGWKRDNSRSGSLVAFSNSYGVIDVMSSQGNQDLSSYVNDYVSMFKKDYPDFNLIGKATTTLSGKNAYAINGTFSYASNKFRLAAIILKAKDIYVIEDQSSDSTWNKDGSAIISSLSSFSLTK